MVRIRLRRVGKKKQPSYRVMVADGETAPDARFLENIGFYDPRSEPPTLTIDAERARYWLSQGAQPSDTVIRLFRKVGVLPQGEVTLAASAEKSEEEPAAQAG
jgi:small subunit ribosomal protein S16